MSDKDAHPAIKFAWKNKNTLKKRKQHIVYSLKSDVFAPSLQLVIVVHHTERQKEMQATLGFKCVLCKVNWIFSYWFLTGASSETLTKDKPLTDIKRYN